MSLEKKIQKKVEEEKLKIVKQVANKCVEDMTSFINACFEALRLEGYGDKRINRVIDNMNVNLPEHLQMNNKGER